MFEGASLSDLIAKGPMDSGLLLKIALQVASALEHAHNHGVIHRDIKPSNLIIVDAEFDSPSVKLPDFGLAKIVNAGDNKTLTKTGEIVATPTYMSPE